MHRLLRNIHIRPKIQRYFSTDTSQKNVPLITEPKPRYTFLPHVYGLQLRSHLFPNNMKNVRLSEEEVKFYQKVSPNYVVGLIRKVMDDANVIDEQNKVSVRDQFYDVATYCKIKYLSSTELQLQGLFRTRIQDIKEIKIQKNNVNQIFGAQQHSLIDGSSAIKQVQQGQTEQEQVQSSNTPSSFQQMLKKSAPNRYSKKTGQQKIYYSLKVKKIQQLPLVINSRLQMKFKYLIDTYMIRRQNIHPSSLPVVFNIIDISRILDTIANECSETNSNKNQVQQCLEQIDNEARIDLVQKMLQKTISITQYMGSIEHEAKTNLRNKKFYQYYSEIMKIAKQVLDGKKTKQLFIEKCTKSFEENNPTKQIRQVFEQELEKYQHMDENSMQAGVVKSYIEELSKIPYNVKSEEIFDLQFAEKVLDQDHYGMKQVKDAIMEVIAVGKLKKTLKGKIFCFIGGPGLGKTSFAKSVAKALNRKFYNISLGGVSDSSALKGHRRTYVGAYSGKIIEALKNCGTNNPVILLDEIDKMGSSYQGDPRSELLQILDPNQNYSFVDNYIDVPVDLSNVLFITSANYEQNISKPLLDRMEKIKLSSYTKAQKVQIFNRHLLRRAIEKSGVKENEFEIPQQTIHKLVEEYSLGEPGVRYLQKSALNILQKIAYKIVTQEQQVPIKVTSENLNKYLGNSYFRLKDHNKIGKGVAISLGGGSYGGRLTYIEAFKKSYVSRKDINRGILFTGSLGDVFKEAMNISYTYARNFLLENLDNRFLYQNQVHLHAPEGASKKDGSTDSLTIVAALVSLAIQKKVKTGIALTGQLTLNGHVLRTHGIKQKILVAKRERIGDVVVPKQNLPDVDALSEDLKEGINFHYVSSFNEVFEILFPGVKIPKKKLQSEITSS